MTKTNETVNLRFSATKELHIKIIEFAKQRNLKETDVMRNIIADRFVEIPELRKQF